MSSEAEKLEPVQPTSEFTAGQEVETSTPRPEKRVQESGEITEEELKEMVAEVEASWKAEGLTRPPEAIQADVSRWVEKALKRLAEVEKITASISSYQQWSALRHALGTEGTYFYPPTLALDSLEADIGALPDSTEKDDWQDRLEEMRNWLEKLQNPLIAKYWAVREHFEEKQVDFKEAHDRFLKFLRLPAFQGPSLEATKKKIIGLDRSKYAIKDEELAKMAEVAEAVLSNPEDSQDALKEVLNQVEEEQERLLQKRARQRFVDPKLEDRLERLGAEQAAISDLLAEVKEKLFAKPDYSVKNLAEYTLAQAFDPSLWSEEERGTVQELASNYLKIKNQLWSPEKKAALRDLIRIVWPRVNVTICSTMEFKRYKGAPVMKRGSKKFNLDSQACREIFHLAGIPRESYTSALARERAIKQGKLNSIGGYTRPHPPGAKEKIPGIMLNTSGEEGIESPVYQRIKNWEKEGQIITPVHYREQLSPTERILFIDHHGAFSKTSSSAAKFFFEAFDFLGFFDQDQLTPDCRTKGYTKEIIKAAIDYATLEDNKNHPAWQGQKDGEWEKNSPRTILGLTSRLGFVKLLDLIKELGEPEKFVNDQVFKNLSDEEIKRFGLEAASKRQQQLVEEAKEIKVDLDKSGLAIVSRHETKKKKKEEGGGEIKRFTGNGFVYELDSPKYGKVLLTLGGYCGGIDAVRGLFGDQVLYVIYNSDFRSLFVSSAGQKLPKDLMEKGFLLRDKMWIIPFASADFPSMRDTLEKLGVRREDNRAVVASFKEIQQRGGKEINLERAGKIGDKYFKPYYRWLKGKIDARNASHPQEEKIEPADLLGDKLTALLECRLKDYLAYVIHWQEAKRKGGPRFLRDQSESLANIRDAIEDAFEDGEANLADLPDRAAFQAEVGLILDELDLSSRR